MSYNISDENPLALASGYQLNECVIECFLGQGGFGIVYKAYHEPLDETVVIKEFLPVELAGRNGDTIAPHSSKSSKLFKEMLSRFMEEGRVLVKLKPKHPNIVNCRNLFRANGSAYLVMDFEDGLPFDVLLKSHEAQGTNYTEEQLLQVLIPLAEGIEYLHSKNVLHRDIKPANVFIRRENNSPVLLDFGAAKQNFAEVTQSYAPFTDFYAPIDQLDITRKPSVAIDIHAFGGLMYRAVTGKVGPRAEARSTGINIDGKDPLEPASDLAKEKYSIEFLELIDECLAFKPSDRPPTMAEVRAQLIMIKDRNPAEDEHLEKNDFESPVEFSPPFQEPEKLGQKSDEINYDNSNSNEEEPESSLIQRRLAYVILIPLVLSIILVLFALI